MEVWRWCGGGVEVVWRCGGMEVRWYGGAVVWKCGCMEVRCMLWWCVVVVCCGGMLWCGGGVLCRGVLCCGAPYLVLHRKGKVERCNDSAFQGKGSTEHSTIGMKIATMAGIVRHGIVQTMLCCSVCLCLQRKSLVTTQCRGTQVH